MSSHSKFWDASTCVRPFANTNYKHELFLCDSSRQPTMSQEKQDVETEVPASLERLAHLLQKKEHELALNGDVKLADSARQAMKDVFDLGEFPKTTINR